MQKKFKLSKKQEFLCGSIGGIISDSCSHPFDTLRARIVMKNKASFQYNRSLTNSIRSIYKSEGLRGFYRGFTPVAIFTIPAHGIYFSSYYQSKRLLRSFYHKLTSKHIKDDGFLLTITAGLISDVFGSFLWVPSDVIKQNVMVYSENTPSKVVKDIFKREGFKGFFRGYFAAMYTFAPYIMLNFGFYEKIKSFFAAKLNVQKDEMPKYYYFISSCMSSSMASLITTPFDVGKTRIQCDQSKIQRNLFLEVLDIVKNEGVYSLFEAWKARCLWFALGTAMTFLTFESCKNIIIDKQKEKYKNDIDEL